MGKIDDKDGDDDDKDGDDDDKDGDDDTYSPKWGRINYSRVERMYYSIVQLFVASKI